MFPHDASVSHTWSTTDDRIHAQKRRVLSQVFSVKSLRSAEHFIHINTDRWLQLLENQAHPNNPIDMCEWTNWLVFDILGEVCFGRAFDMKEPNSNLRHVPGLITTYMKINHCVGWKRNFINSTDQKLTKIDCIQPV